MRRITAEVRTRRMICVSLGVALLVSFPLASAWAQSAEETPAPEATESESTPMEVNGMQIRIDVLVGGGTVMAWDGLYGVRIAITGAGILPDSRFQGHFGALWVDLQYRPFEPWYHLEPYLVVGAGLAFPDRGDPTIIAGLPPATQWSTAHQFLGLAGLGLSYGAPTGLCVAVDVRAVNLTHGTVNLLAGYRF
jgi:hypothetical protein